MTTSNVSEAAPAGSSAQQPVGYEGVGAQMRSSLLSNVAATVGALWSVFLFMGGLVFLVYFASIGFMPEIDLQTGVALLAVSALTGGFLLLMLSFYLLVPGWWWVQMTHRLEPLQSPGWFSLPMLGVILSVFLMPRWWYVISLVVVSGVVLPLLFLLGGTLLEKLLRSGRKQLEKLGRKPWGWPSLKAVVIFYGGFLPSVCIFVPLFLLVSGLIRENQALREDAVFAALSAVIVIWTSNTMLVAAKSFSVSRYLILAAVTLLLLFAQLDTWSFIPRRVMSIYKFGNLKNASLVLNEIGCTIVKLHGLTATPYTPDPKLDSPSQKACALRSVTIHSRIGNTYYLEVPRSGDTLLRFTIPGQNVLSWAVNEPSMAAIAGAPTRTQSSAPTTDTTPPNKGIEPTR